MEKKQAMSSGPDFNSEAPLTRNDFFVRKNKGFDRAKNSQTMKNIQEIYNKNRPATSTPAPQFFHSRNSGKRAFSASRRATLQEEMHRENMEIQQSMRDLDRFDQTVGQMKKRVGYPRINLEKDLINVNG